MIHLTTYSSVTQLTFLASQLLASTLLPTRLRSISWCITSTMAQSLLLLPPEIRIKIYGYVLCGIDNQFDLAWTCDDPGNRKQPNMIVDDAALLTYTVSTSIMVFRRDPALRRSPIAGLLGTCRQIYNEAVAILYEENCFYCDPSEHMMARTSRTPLTIVDFPPKSLV